MGGKGRVWHWGFPPKHTVISQVFSLSLIPPPVPLLVALRSESNKILEYRELAGTHKDYRVQFLATRKTT